MVLIASFEEAVRRRALRGTNMISVSEGAKRLVLLVLGLAGGRIITERMYGLAFLVNQEVYHWVVFEPEDHETYSEELTKAIDKLEKEGKLIYDWNNDNSSLELEFYLTEKGKQEAEVLLEWLKAKDDDKLKRAMEIIQKHKDDPIPYLRAYIKKHYLEHARKK